MRDAEGLSLSGVGWVTGEEDKGNYSDGISVMRDESEDERVGGLVFVWWVVDRVVVDRVVVDRVVVGVWIVRWYGLFHWGCLEMGRRPLVVRRRLRSVVVLILVVRYMILRWSRSCPTIRRRIGFVRECGARLL